jgi:hypothetical protein
LVLGLVALALAVELALGLFLCGSLPASFFFPTSFSLPALDSGLAPLPGMSMPGMHIGMEEEKFTYDPIHVLNRDCLDGSLIFNYTTENDPSPPRYICNTILDTIILNNYTNDAYICDTLPPGCHSFASQR